MRIVPLIAVNKQDFYKEVLAGGGEGVMLKDLRAPYVQEGRPKSMYKAKRVEEVDCFVVGGEPGDEDAGWKLLIGNLNMSCITETGKVHMVARVSNLTLEDRIDASVCGKCAGKLSVRHENVAGKRKVLGTSCLSCGAVDPVPALNSKWMRRVAEVHGQEWTARVYRLKHAFVERWREGADGKAPEDCKVNLAQVQRRFENASLEL